MKISLIIVPSDKIGNRTVLTIELPATRFFWGHGAATLECGQCHTMLAKDVWPKDLAGKLLKCNVCESINLVSVK